MVSADMCASCLLNMYLLEKYLSKQLSKIVLKAPLSQGNYWLILSYSVVENSCK